MIFYIQRRKIFRYFKYFYVILKVSFHPVNKKRIYFDVKGIAVNRYLYSFLKMFQLEGYTVFIPKNVDLANNLFDKKGEFKYASWLLDEKVVKFGKPLENKTLAFSRDRLSNDYYSPGRNGYHVPMSCYPWYYKNYSHIKEIRVSEKRKRSIFMAGNIDEKFYDKISHSNFFSKIPSRKRTADYLRNSSFYYRVRNGEELKNFINGNLDNKVILIDSSSDFRVPLDQLLFSLNHFYFYFALPGIIIPQSHNLMEAMLCGCIPVIHKEYALLLDPPLEPLKNAIFFNTLSELIELIEGLFSMEEKEIQRMRRNVLSYYLDYLSPKAVVQQVIESKPEKIYLQAEHISLNLSTKHNGSK